MEKNEFQNAFTNNLYVQQSHIHYSSILAYQPGCDSAAGIHSCCDIQYNSVIVSNFAFFFKAPLKEINMKYCVYMDKYTKDFVSFCSFDKNSSQRSHVWTE